MTQLAGALSSFAVVAVIAIALPAHAAYPPEGGSSLPDVNMEAVLLAAQLDPPKSGTGITPGSKESVARVERALVRKGLLAKSSVDGHYGSSTRSAYSRWQRRLGASTAIGANGLPGKTSLTKLGKGRFEVKRIVVPGSQVNVDGERINRRTNRMKMAAARRLRRDCKFSVTQGSYSTDVGESAGTHAGGGALDISVNRGCGARHRSAVEALRQVGFAAWYRPTLPGEWPAHIHAIAISDPDLSGPAQEQVSDYYRGRNGLADDGPDNGPNVKKRTWEQYMRSR
jgi:peptidoglycan hydrolase-like protein with peptidoglycan-binding domain